MSKYSIVVVARDHPRPLLAALLHIRRYARPGEVLLVDNASTVELGRVAALAQQPVHRLRLTEHGSLGAALNAGIDAAAHDLVLLMHGDVLLQTDPVATVDWLERHSEIGIVGGHLLAEGPGQGRIVHAGYAMQRGRVAPKRLSNWVPGESPTPTEAVAAVNDACMLLRRTDIRFDERYWFTLEDVDLCHQYRQRGYGVVSSANLQAHDPSMGGAREKGADLTWMARGLASHLLYHERWCSDLPLDQHPRQPAVRGAAAAEYLRDVDRRLTSTQREVLLPV
jgi:GT2 family glycosyltransferase